MKATVDKDLCIGCGLCADVCSEVFEMEDDVAEVIADPVPADSESCATEAMEGCPVDAISLD